MLATALLALAVTVNPGPGPGLNEAVRMAAAVQYNAVVAWQDAAQRDRHMPTSTGSSNTNTSTTKAQSSTGASSPLAAIRACESGDDYRAVSAGGQYRGAYQFDRSTWNSVGGTGDPAAASVEEQDARASILYQRAGTSPWPVCG